MYDIRDILNKGIEVARKKRSIYEKIREDNGDIRVRMMVQVMLNAVDTDIKHYQNMISNITDEMAEAIDFGTYDKIASLVNQFSRLFLAPEIRERGLLLDYAIEIEKSIYALLVDIKGRLVTSEVITNSISYYVLIEMIETKQEFILELESFKKTS
ncbi:hypothetical protein [Fusibacter ferrireducens]|uniref:PhoU domain-containing protein n=1 Tax=Fusibacter ferrireducens TaxID=2785058 RepID=A0ABR9ZR19_9FIRM|nr:hypothetical protein [Fusibacter ferrireducens]MBF4692894.1 hypothetical protein [Fusibacter ferrireducens]